MRRLTAVAAALLLAACATPAPQYFVLPDSQYSKPAARSEELALKVILAEPLNNGGLVYQTDAYHINFARNHLWAASLNEALAASLSNKLNRLDSRYLFVPAGRSQSSKTLTVYIESFNGSYTGETQVGGYAQWPDGRSKPFLIRTPQQGDGYTAMVESLEQGLNRAAASILY
ncbi:PqiC family protein [Neisseria lisongii]|uniref:ABC-type transport auxiliary lipoprotein family protein n=1 Tax=Neisseria lisongii TaxID=2912188 RepID=A0AAW5AIT1_9NEIS|nr:ABC-type transport auxiliary lipoprotein family protein [Neisseria lisongii]MCF7529783.1 ABC-type transport auxiliary lipoprotein family protein [Neisseria lisongii]